MKKFILLVVLSAFSAPSFAGIFVDPGIGYSLGSTDELGQTGFYRGLDLNLKAGYKYLGFFGGFDGSYTNGTREAISNFTQEDTYELKNYGLFAGYQTPFMLRAWAGFMLSSSFEDSFGNAYKGNGFKLGIGLKFLPFVSANLEYRVMNFDERRFSNTQALPLNGNQQLDSQAIVFSISLPWDIPLKL